MMTAGIDQSADVVHPGGFSTPRNDRNWLTGPNSGGLNSMFQTTAIATIDVMYGKNAAVRKNATPRSLRFSSSASPREAASVSGMWKTV